MEKIDDINAIAFAEEWSDGERPLGICLAGCCNLNSIQENASLLLYGYLNSQLHDRNLYKRVPVEIILLIFNLFCFDLETLNAMDSKYKSDQWLVGGTNTETESEWNLDTISIAKYDKDEANKCWQSKTSIDRYTMRRIWRLKVTKINKDLHKNASIDFVIGLNNIADMSGNYELDIANGKITSTKSDIIIQENDIISVIYVHRDKVSAFQWNGWLRFYVNDEPVSIRYKTAAMFQSNTYKLTAKLYDFIQLQML